MLNNPGTVVLNSPGFFNCSASVFTFSANVALRLAQENEDRAYAIIQNVGNRGDVTVYLGEVEEVNEGIIVKPGGSYEINRNNLYTGQIKAISDYTTAQINFTECTN